MVAAVIAGTPDSTQDWYGLMPLQAGMLFDALRRGRGRGFDIEQVHIVLHEALDPQLLGTVWKRVTRRHAALCTKFRWDGERPEQSVESSAELPVSQQDLTSLTASECCSEVARFLETDREQGFDLSVAPLSRLRLFQVGSTHWELVWTVHHLVIDATSLCDVLVEVFSGYEQLCRGEEAAVAAVPQDHAELVSWVAERDLAASREFFRELLRGRSSPTPLPCAELNGEATDGTRGASLVRTSEPALMHELRAYSERTQVSISTLAQAAWALVLARYTNERDVVFGVTRGCRRSPPRAMGEKMVGLVANTLPCRVLIDDAEPVQDWLHKLREQNLALREHEHTPLFEIERQPGAERPLFETTLTFLPWQLNARLRELGGDGWSRRWCALHERPVPALNLKLSAGATLEATWMFDPSRIKRQVIERLASALFYVLEGFVQSEAKALSQLSVLTPAQRERMLFHWNQTGRAFPDQQLIHEPFEQRVATQPLAIAVEVEGVALCYQELDQRANRLAHALRAQGAGPGRYVAICLSRGVELLVALLAVAKSGAAYVPLDPRYPRPRLQFMLRDSGAALVVTEQAHAGLFGDHVRVLADAPLPEFPSTRPERTARAADVCYAIYTSGSTGEPNGVVLSHRAVLNTFDWVTRTLRVRPGDRLLFVTSPCFDLSVYDTFGVLGAGGTVVVATESQLNDPSQLARLLTERQITIWDSAPAILNALMPFCEGQGKGSQLRLCMLSGDWIPVPLPDAVRSAFPGCQVVSLGGATEAAIWSNWYPVAQVDPTWPSIPYGVPIQNASYHVLDDAMRPVPVGVAGNLYIGGACLAEGYLNRTQLTRERFVQDPFRGQGERLYRTGDRALYLEDGTLRLLGRADSQLKIRGFRVELGEVEAALSRLPGVEQAVCASYLDGSGQRALAAYVVPQPGAVPDSATLRHQLAEVLPAFAVPTQVLWLAALPVSLNGKIDRKALPTPGQVNETRSATAPRTELEQQLVTLWEELLQHGSIGIHDDFFAVGGHSLLAINLIAKLKSRLGLEVSLEQLMAHPTIEALSAAAERSRSAATAEPDLFLLFNSSGTRPPIVLFPGIHGTLFMFRGLVERLGPDQPVFLAQAIAATSPGALSEQTIECMAEVYAAKLRALHPHGPVVLGGFSFGALIAFELSQRLRERGREVPLLVSLDGFAPRYPEFLPKRERLLAHVREFAYGKRALYVLDRLANTRRRVLRALGREYELSPELLSATPEMRQRIRRLWRVHTEAHRRYNPKFRHPGALLLFQAEQPERLIGIRNPDAVHGWSEFVDGDISVVTLPGEHGTIMEDANQAGLVQALNQHLRQLWSTPLSERERGPLPVAAAPAAE